MLSAGSTISGSNLFVAGCPKDGKNLWTYFYDSDTNMLMQTGNPIDHNAIIYTTKCVTLECNGDLRTFTVIAGQQAGGANLKVLQYNQATQEFVLIDQALFGDTIYALDVCYDSTGCATIVVGGTPVTECGQTYNMRIYKLDCNGLLIACSFCLL